MFETTSYDTLYAPAARESERHVNEQKDLMLKNKLVLQFCNSISQMLVVLNQQRQIIYANKPFITNLGLLNPESYIGKRPGEAINCAHAIQSEGGCGTTEFCRTCGAVNAILESQQGKQSIKECRITTANKDALDLKVTATPVKIENEQFSIFEVNDISNEKRRQSLEKVFFHDVLNSAGGISGLSDIIGVVEDPKEIVEIAGMIHTSAHNLVSDIQAQRQLSAAERGDLMLNLTESYSNMILKGVAELYSKHEVTGDKLISIDPESESFMFKTDLTLMRRILGNMTKNALEASIPKSKITLKAQETENAIIFSVHNPGFMQRSVQMQLFKRSYSTKGAGRGLGTYSMKLFGEKFLKGKVYVESSEEKGTTFFMKLNK
jgi:signal transduction histidine kinase